MSRIKGVRNKLGTKERLLLGTLNHGHACHTEPALRGPFDSVSTCDCDCIQVRRMGEEGGEEAKAVSQCKRAIRGEGGRANLFQMTSQSQKCCYFKPTPLPSSQAGYEAFFGPPASSSRPTSNMGAHAHPDEIPSVDGMKEGRSLIAFFSLWQ